jgi:hypothetical protein
MQSQTTAYCPHTPACQRRLCLLTVETVLVPKTILACAADMLCCISRLQLHAFAVLEYSQSLMSEDNVAELGRIQSSYVGSCTARKRATDQAMHAVRNHCWQPLICSPLSAGCLRHCSASSVCDDDLPVCEKLSVREHCLQGSFSDASSFHPTWICIVNLTRASQTPSFG